MTFKPIIAPLTAAVLLSTGIAAVACTSMVVSGRASKSGRPMLWKHRDTSQCDNFVERCGATDSTFAYVALYNGGDSTLSEAWTGVNSRGFAIMNTASYNLAPDTAVYKDQEGRVMAKALKFCKSVSDFESMLKNMRQPRGVQANFGVIDAFGAAAYFEVSDNSITRFDADDDASACLIRSNYSYSGEPDGGYGYIRHDNAAALLAEKIAGGTLIPEDFTEMASRSFYHSILGTDSAADSCRWIIDQDYIPRYTSTAALVIEGVNSPDEADECVMWVAIGYPPCAIVEATTVNHVPDGLRPLAPGFKSALCNEALQRKNCAFPLKRGNGRHYIDMDYVRECSARCHKKSVENYAGFRQNRH